MVFKDFEKKIKGINKQIFDFFKETEENENSNITNIFTTLQNNFEDEKIGLETIEKQMITNNIVYQDRLKEIENLIHQVELTTKDPIYDIESKRAEFDSQKHVELNPVYVTLKKRKTEVVHKIGNLKKELANILKERSIVLADEEKKRKSRENELLRRLKIDIQRTIDGNIKEYGDLEKSLLDINDENTINSIMKNINSIRTRGLKDLAILKNKYALAVFENNLEFKKFEEKINLENNIDTNDYNIKIKELEIQKTEIEDEEAFAIQVYNFENEKNILLFEKENALFLNHVNTEKDKEIIDLKYQDYQVKSTQNDSKHQAIRVFQKQVFNFDGAQYRAFKPIDTILSSNTKSEISFLLEGLVDIIDSFKENLISILDKTFKNKKEVNESLKHYLIISVKEKANDSSFYYKNVVTELQKKVESYYRNQRSRLRKLKNVISNMFVNLLKQVNSISDLIKEYQKEDLLLEKEYSKRIEDVLTDGYRNSLENCNIQYKRYCENLYKYENSLKREQLEKEENSKVCNLKIVQEYEYKLNQLEQKIKQFQFDFKSTADKEKTAFKHYVKNNKNKISQYKRICNENIIKHEKDLYKKYKEDLYNNETDRKNKAKEL